jgi:hypothetical protein
MDKQAILSILSKVDGASFAALDTVTVPALKGGKANPMQGKLLKVCLGHRVMLFSNKQNSGYENKVRRHLIKEGKNPDSFVMGSLPWGERIPDSPFIQHKDKLYLQCVFLKPGTTEYRVKETIVGQDYGPILPGSLLSKDQIEGLDDRTGSEHQNLEDQVIVRTYALDSIVGLRAFNESLS